MILATVAAALIVFGAVWTAVIFPALNKIPHDLEWTVQYQGNITVLDAETSQPVTYDVVGTRTFTTVRCSGDTIYLREEISFTDASTGQYLPLFAGEALLAVNRVSRANVAGHGDEDREGYWTFPRDVKASGDYALWITGNPATLEARYLGEEDFRGLHVLVYEVATPEEGLTLPASISTPPMQLHQRIVMKVEPVCGTTVYFQERTTRTANIPVLDEMFPSTGAMTFSDVAVGDSTMVFTEETVNQLVHDAKFYHWALPWGETYLSLVVFGLGLALGLLGWVWVSRAVSEEALEEVPAVEPVGDVVTEAQSNGAKRGLI